MDETTTSDGLGLDPVALAEIEEQLTEQLEQAKEELQKAEEEMEEELNSLAHKITSDWQQRMARRAQKEQGWMRGLTLYLGPLGSKEYNKSTDSPWTSVKHSRRPDRNIVFTKCEIAKAHLFSMQFAGDEKNFELIQPSYSNDPNAPEAARLMEAVIADQLEACGYKAEVNKAIHDLVVLGTGILKGPINSGKPRKRFVAEMDPMTGQTVWIPEFTVERVPEIKRVNPWYAFPDDTVTNINDANDFIEVHPMSRAEFAALRKNKAFIREAVDEVLSTAPEEFIGDSITDFTAATDTNPNALRNKYLVLERHGPITATQLGALEIEVPYELPEGQDYYGEVWVCNNKVIRMELENIEGCFKPPYSGDVWQEDPASPFGFGVAEKLADAQRVVTQAWHMILDNASASSAPQVVINEDMIDPRNGNYEIAPGKIWYFTDIAGDVRTAFQYFETPNVTQNLFPVLEAAKISSDEESGIALLTAGLQAPEVSSDTATGQSIMARAATVLLDQKSDSWDINAVAPRLKAMYDWNMQYNEDPYIKADMEIRVKPATAYRNKQMHLRDMEKLSVESANNPMLAEHLNYDGLTRARISAMNIPSQNIVKSMEEVMAAREEAAKNPPPPPPEVLKYEIDKLRLDLEQKRLMLEEAKMNFEMTANQQREAWEHEERMVNTYARIAEAEAAVVKSQNEKEIALLDLASKSEDAAERNRLTMGIALINDGTKRFLASQQNMIKERDQLLTAKELEMKAKHGTGI